MNQLHAAIKTQINDTFYVLSEDPNLLIAVVAPDFNIPTQIFQKKINRICLLFNWLFNHKSLLNTLEQGISKYIGRFDL